ncbi:histidine--tRNA ligase [Thermobrachium celere]|uniref:Histidine--tRNA ligase n=1 Tax=Thermobrachium celere DSM 8682 TaxID=941824 RepID=R7RST6_9CLOT|nr:histidine--tRNA ligase [Thermobrachium celere]GFR35801.1 histidine--tRNA ligase [Thermobrachium celere]CDF58320.1 Histidyl-tRNA synthetase [Thermobrachium celere DSM 8682]
MLITKAPKGTKDVLPKDVYKWQYIEQKVREVCSYFGFTEIRTPTFEHTELVQRGVGETTDIFQKEMYTFLDKAGRSITLKPEGTAPAARAYLENNLYADVQPTKLFYITPVFRYENVQAGRLREHHQFGVELFGSKEATADAEVISLAFTFFNSLGLDELKVNINNIGCPDCRPNYNNALKEYLKANFDELCPVCKDRYERNPLRVLDCKNDKCKKIAEGAPVVIDYICDECKNHFEELKAELDALGISYVVDPYIVRGLDYYTKTVFEIISEDIGAKSTVCGGGRYDNLIEEIGGPKTPAVGFGLGIERLLLMLESKGIEIPNNKRKLVYIASLGERAKREASKIAFNLRREGISVEKDIMNRSLKAQMKYANKIGADYVIIIGDEELDKGVAKIKDMATGQEREILITDIKSSL